MIDLQPPLSAAAIPTQALCQKRWQSYIYYVETDRLLMCCKTRFSPVARSFDDDLRFNIQQRQQMLDGKRPSDCDKCWELEDQGLPSFRKFTKAFVDSIKDVSTFAAQDRPASLEIVMERTCDLACVYCNEESSSKWRQKKGLPVDRFKYTAEARARLNQRLERWWPSLSEVMFLGGEPLIQETFYLILAEIHSRAVLSKDRPPLLSVTTNLNTPPVYFDRFLAWLKSYNGPFAVYISLDAVGPVGERIRDGLNFARLNENFTRLLGETSHHVQVGVCPVLTHMNVPVLADLFSYVHEKMRTFDRDIFPLWNVVSGRKEFSPLRFPEALAPAYESARPVLDRIGSDTRRSAALRARWRKYQSQLERLTCSP